MKVKDQAAEQQLNLAKTLESRATSAEAVLGEGLAGETPRVVADEGELSDLGDKPGKNTLA